MNLVSAKPERRFGVRLSISALASLLVWLAAPSPASAETVEGDPMGGVDQALAHVAAPEPEPNSEVSLPEDADEPASLEGDSGSLEMSIPLSGKADVSASDQTSQVFIDDDVAVALQSTEDGLRALINIDSEDAPERYHFEIGGDVASLELALDGGVLALDDDGMIVAVAAPPWAVDAKGVHVPTYFEIDGTSLYQIVSHRGGEFEYGIVADPWWNPFSWNWSKAFSSAKGWLGKRSKWLGGKTWSTAKRTVKIAGRSAKVLVKKAGPFGLVLCTTGSGWAWYRSDGKGWVRVGDAVAGCFL